MASQDASGTPTQNAAVKGSHTRIVFGVVVALIAVAVLWFTGFGSYIFRRAAYTPPAATFAGSSESLPQTVIVPTLDSPCPAGKNVIWCSSFQLAWNELKDKVVRAPLQVIGAEEIAARLNAARPAASDLDPSSFYAAGGRTGDGIVGKIEKEMAARFPARKPPDLQKHAGESAGVLAYSYLSARAPFQYPFRQVERPFAFADSSGVETRVEAFGVWNYSSRYDRIRRQVEVLYYRHGSDRGADAGERHTKEEYALDLCKDSHPYQVVVALVERQDSLARTLEYIRPQVEAFRQDRYTRWETQLKKVDKVEIPEMVWRIDHQFQELIGKTVSNVGLPVAGAMQTIEFRLDRTGVVLESDAYVNVLAAPREFIFNRPFLVYMQKRGAEQPFFVMWVDNAELLTRK